ncbi:DUF5667 domain-containing protein [Umezawaea sp. Da 62-37]|uniref:DUF5667 domain-containing protein n=1 Tax=Umezawaea sp. Da 62-37 TaxID=3075927 RepID=UPI0028F6ECD7|nr:DUF5667 domain-containing protein [Umezawaea sp. Da 62-37]WNV91048.1 DUF5667 domain-containing protein [Umezawaea sp. Da 62-37]
MVGRGITPLGRRRQHERFARAVEARPDDVDAELADELAVVDLLRAAAAGSGPDAAARERMRARVLGAERPTAPVVLLPKQRRSSARGRLAVAAAAALCLVLSLAGMSLLLSRDALPGDALYGMKRTAESASLGFTFGDESKALKRLEFAAARLVEMETLADKYDDQAPLGGFLGALADFDADAAAGARELATVGANSDERVLATLADWSGSQAERLAALEPRLPEPAVTRSATSLDLLSRIGQRAAELRARTNCSPVTTGASDDIGPLPATTPCAPPPTTQGSAPPRQPSILVSEPRATVPSVQAPPASAPVPGTPTTGAASGTPQILPDLPITSVLPTVPASGLPTLVIPLPVPLSGLPGIRFGT